MPHIEIRRLQGDDLVKHWRPLTTYAFSETPPLNLEQFREEYLPYVEKRHIQVLFEDDVPLATATTIEMAQAIRGKVLSMGGVASVATQPRARRKGFARQVVQAALEYMHQQEYAVSTLYPFRESFYGRLGYVGFVKQRVVSVRPGNLQSAMRFVINGSVDYMHFRDAYDTYRSFMEEMQPSIHGLSLFSPEIDTLLRDKGESWVAIARQDSTIVGMMLYKMGGMRKPMTVRLFISRTPAGKYLLLNWLARHVDQASEIWLRMRADEYLETWLNDADIHLHSTNFEVSHPFGGPTPMGRVLRIDKLDGIQVGEGAFTAEIKDEECGWNNGIYRFASNDGRLNIEKVEIRPDCTLSIEGLSALIYGVGDPGEFFFRGWGNPGVETQLIMRRMFPRAFPWLNEEF